MNWVNKKQLFKKLTISGLIFVLLVITAACSSSENSNAEPQQEANPPAQNTPAETPAENQTTDPIASIDKNNMDAIKVTLAGGSVGGFWTALGQVISKSFADSYAGSSATYEPGSGAGNIKLLADGQVEIGLAQSVEVIAAQNGLEPFEKTYDNMMALATIYDNAVLQVSARKDFADKNEVHSFEDIVNKKVPANIAINQKGNMNSAAAYSVLESYGITEESLESWGGSLTWAGSAARFEALQNNRADISMDFVFAPDSKVSETSVNTPLELWSINDNAVKTLKEEWDLNAAVIEKGTYEWQTEDKTVVTLSALILVGEKASPQDQYKMAKALVENLETLRAVHPAMQSMTAEKLANTGAIKLAPGAEEYYKEVGAIK